ncbi:MAG: hypothetical protein ACI8QS_001789 [Planctomycetota bacterium]|jgi:hypothetical protein
MHSFTSSKFLQVWSSRHICIRSGATPEAAANRLRVQLVGPLRSAAAREGLFGSVSETTVMLAWLRPMELAWFRPRLQAEFKLDGSTTLLIGHFAVPRLVRALLGLACLGMVFMLGTLIFGYLREPRVELVFLGVLFGSAALLLQLAIGHLTTHFSELCDRLQEHIGLVIANPPRNNLPRKHVSLEVNRPEEMRKGNSHRSA